MRIFVDIEAEDIARELVFTLDGDECIDLIMRMDEEWSDVGFTHSLINKLLDSLYHDVDIKMDNTQAGRPFILVRDRGKFDHGWEYEDGTYEETGDSNDCQTD